MTCRATSPSCKTYDRVTAAFPGEAAGRDRRGRGRRRHARARWPAAIARAAQRGAADRSSTVAGQRRGNERRRHRRGDRRCRPSAAAATPTATRGDGAGPRASSSRRRSPDVAGAEVNVTGEAAQSKDFNDQLAQRLPLVFAFVLGLAFLLLLVTFRSIVVPIKAIVLNLLSVGAAYGVLVLVFQKGLGESLLGFHSNGGVSSWLPLFLFVILFGLSMDYHVLILSRVREGGRQGHEQRRRGPQGIRRRRGR